MSMQKGEFYDSPNVVRAVNTFRAKGNGFVDFAFSDEDARQVAAVENWLDSTCYHFVYRRLVDEYRKVGILKRNLGKINPSFVEFDPEKKEHDSLANANNYFLRDLVVSIEKHKKQFPHLERFIVLFYIDDLERGDVAKQLGIEVWRIPRYIQKTKDIFIELTKA